MKNKKSYWVLTSIYLSIESPEYLADKAELVQLSQSIQDNLAAVSEGPDFFKQLPGILENFARLADLTENLESYVYAVWSTNTASETAQRELDDLERRNLAVKNVLVNFRAILAAQTVPSKHIQNTENIQKANFWLNEQRQWASKQMHPAEEALAADLQRTGGDAWSRLHNKLTAHLSDLWDGDSKTLTELRAMAVDSDRNVRKRAWRLETGLLKTFEIPLAAALNGVKGHSISLDQRRGWKNTLEKSLFQNRLSQTSLNAMIAAMEKSLPIFHRYFKQKAQHLGLDCLSWYDLLAPVGKQTKIWTWNEVAEFIPHMFDTLSVNMGNFARRAFSEKWIDAHPRSGKVGGAYCTYFPIAKESRILCNFDGSFDAVSTVAHELGHAWHGEMMKDLNALCREYPMTLAETASIFAETLVFQAALNDVSLSEKKALLDTYLMGVSQVIVDILSRFYFESSVLQLREHGELSPRQLSEFMLEAQQRTYGSALREDERHAWMWAVKDHYYSPDLAFYNFPYAFGQLFALALYSCFEKKGAAFAEQYSDLLRFTGQHSAQDVAKLAGFDIEEQNFWQQGLSSIERLVELYEDTS